MSSEGSRRDTLKLSSVCRQWRYIALSVPEIWSKFLLDAFFTPHILHIFLERSKPLQLHIFVGAWTDEQLQVLSSVADRIACMTIFNDCNFLQNQFPNLVRLVLALGPKTDHKKRPASVESLSTSPQFSQLREFCFLSISAAPLHPILDMPAGFPALQKLEVLCEDDSSWDSVVINTSNTLVSLVLHARPTCSTHDFSFPQLRHLQITCSGGQIQLVLDLDAPRLESVELGSRVGGGHGIDIQLQNPRSVKQLFVEHQSLDLALYPALQKLWIYGHTDYNQKTLSLLRHQITLCPELQAIFYRGQSQCWETNHGEDEYSRPESALSAIADVVRETGRDVKVGEFGPTELELPGSVRGNVGIPLIMILFYCHD
jgi:hypothetical protein